MNWYDDPDAEIKRPGKKSPVARRKREPPRRRADREAGGQQKSKGTQCGAKKPDGNLCALAAGYATSHPGYGPCVWHFGDTPAGKKGAAQDLAAELSVFYGKPIETDPIQALLDEVSRTSGYIAWISQRIGQFKVPVVDDEGLPVALPPEVQGWLNQLMSERMQLVRTAKAALDAGINERLVQIAEHQGTRFAGAIEEILDALQLTEKQRALIPQVVPNALRGLMGAAPLLIEGTLEEQVSE